MKTQMQKISFYPISKVTVSVGKNMQPVIETCSDYFCGQRFMKNWEIGAFDTSNIHDLLKSKDK